MPSHINGRHTSICLQTLSTFVKKIFSKRTKPSHPPFIMNTLAPPYLLPNNNNPPPPPPPPPPHPTPPTHPLLYLSTSASQDTRFSDPEPHRIARTNAHHLHRLHPTPRPVGRSPTLQFPHQYRRFILSETIQNNPQIIAAI